MSEKPETKDIFEGSQVQKVVRRATQWELADEIDPSVNFVAHGKFLSFAPRSLGCLDELNPVRQLLVWLITWVWWDRVVLAVILLNTVALAAADYSLQSVNPLDLHPDPERSATNAFLARAEYWFTAVFTIEAICKVLAMGFMFGKGSYLQDGWNVSASVDVAAVADADRMAAPTAIMIPCKPV